MTVKKRLFPRLAKAPRAWRSTTVAKLGWPFPRKRREPRRRCVKTLVEIPWRQSFDFLQILTKQNTILAISIAIPRETFQQCWFLNKLADYRKLFAESPLDSQVMFADYQYISITTITISRNEFFAGTTNWSFPRNYRYYRVTCVHERLMPVKGRI